jgi:hypothetical protein
VRTPAAGPIGDEGAGQPACPGSKRHRVRFAGPRRMGWRAQAVSAPLGPGGGPGFGWSHVTSVPTRDGHARRVRPAVRPPGPQPGNTGSTPVLVTQAGGVFTEARHSSTVEAAGSTPVAGSRGAHGRPPFPSWSMGRTRRSERRKLGSTPGEGARGRAHRSCRTCPRSPTAGGSGLRGRAVRVRIAPRAPRAGEARRVVRPPCKRKVAGSSPAAGSGWATHRCAVLPCKQRLPGSIPGLSTRPG